MLKPNACRRNPLLALLTWGSLGVGAWSFGAGPLPAEAQPRPVLPPTPPEIVGLERSPDGALFVPGQLIVAFGSVDAPTQARVRARHGLERVRTFPWARAELVRLAPGASTRQVLADLQQDAALAWAELDYAILPAAVPNDLSELQWNLENLGQRQGLLDADVDAPEAWERLVSCSDAVVAVVDTGVRLEHPDLIDNLWRNVGELPDNGLDDDGNGYVDDDRGWDFHHNDNRPDDDANHGTHVAGILGARGNNGQGMVGVCWQASIMPVRVMGRFYGSTSSVVSGIVYAIDNGAAIVNASFSSPRNARLMEETILESDAQGVLIVAAAGNDSVNIDEQPAYPASYQTDNLIAVAATTRTDQLASFSNYGPLTVHLAAPGLDIYSTMVSQDYGLMNGTSMAVPHVSAAAALLLAQNPLLTPLDLRTLLINQSDPVGALDAYTLSGGRMNLFTTLEDPLAQEGGQPSPYVP